MTSKEIQDLIQSSDNCELRLAIARLLAICEALNQRIDDLGAKQHTQAKVIMNLAGIKLEQPTP